MKYNSMFQFYCNKRCKDAHKEWHDKRCWKIQKQTLKKMAEDLRKKRDKKIANLAIRDILNDIINDL